MRLFIALDLPDDVRRELRDVQMRLSAHSRAVRWSDPVGMHLTLHFLGETPERLVEPLLAGMRAITVPALRLSLDRLGCFPPTGSLRVVWVGLSGDLAGLEALFQSLASVIQSVGLPTDPRPFTLTSPLPVPAPQPRRLSCARSARRCPRSFPNLSRGRASAPSSSAANSRRAARSIRRWARLRDLYLFIG